MKSLFANCMLPVGMNKIFLNIATIVLMSTIFTACLKAPLTNPDTGGKYDGVYDFSFVTSTPSGNQTIVLPAGFFIVKKGVISSSDNTLSGTVLDDFGNVQFTGPCPINNGTANFTGMLNALSGPKFGQGNYTCQIGGITRTWRAYNGK